MADKNTLFPYSENTRKEVLKYYGRDENSVLDDIKIVREWCQTQPHLPQIPSDRRIEITLVLNKFSIEKTKQKIDMFYTIRTLWPELFVNPKSPQTQQVLETLYYLPLPKLTPDFHRIVLFKLKDTNPDRYDPTACSAYSFNITEIRFFEDYIIGDIIVVDMDGSTLAHLVKYNIVLLKKLFTILQELYSNRFKGIHFINAPSYVDVLISSIKSVVKPKIAQRVHVHQSVDTLYEAVPKECLPKDYGGDQLSLAELQELFRQKLAEYQKHFDLLDTLKVDESLRPEKLKNDELLGYYGNFKKLDVD